MRPKATQPIDIGTSHDSALFHFHADSYSTAALASLISLARLLIMRFDVKVRFRRLDICTAISIFPPLLPAWLPLTFC